MVNEINIGDAQAVEQPKSTVKITIFYSVMLKEVLIQLWVKHDHDP